LQKLNELNYVPQGVRTIRHLSDDLGRRGAAVIRINPREAQIPSPHISISAGALDGLRGIASALAA